MIKADLYGFELQCQVEYLSKGGIDDVNPFLFFFNPVLIEHETLT